MLYGINAGGQAVFTLDGGTIENNVSKSFDGKDASGAVNVEGNAALTMNGGAIRNNRCGDGMPGVKGYVGGGVCVVDAYENEKPTTNASFTMNGGSIIGNSAGSGGGIYSFSNNVHLNGGLIAGNTASMNGGGVYSEGCPGIGYSTLYMKNALIVDNAAVGPDGQGGGMWFCPTGDGVVYEVEGAAIYSNRADGAGDDFASVRWADREFTVTLPNVIPGGSGVEWYVDGGVTISSGSGDVQAGIDGNIPRYRPHSGAKPVTIENCTSSVALKAVTELDPEGLADELAHMGFAKLIIADNQAEYGGGVGANGGIVVGRELKKPVRVGVRKAWNGTPDEYAKAIRVKLYAAWNDGARSGYPVAYGELNADNEWNYTFENIPYMEEDLQALGLTDDQIKNWENFFVVEVLGEGLPEFDEECGKIEKVSDEEDLFEIHLTNTMKSGTLILHKDILGEFNGTDKEKVEENLSFTVTGPYGFERVIPYSSFTNGTYTLENVPVGEYTVTESGEELADYSVKTAIVGNPATVPENGKAEVSFTNTYMPDHPETDITIIKRWEGDTPFMRPDEIHIKIGAKNDPGYTDNRTLTAAEDQVSEDEWRHKYYGWWIRDYVITEVNVPAHYTSSVEHMDEHTFVITNTYMPQTGDGSHPALYAAMTALAGAVLLALRKRRAA